MPRIHSPDSADCTRSAEEEFLDLLLADDDLLRAEFDAIIARNGRANPRTRPADASEAARTLAEVVVVESRAQRALEPDGEHLSTDPRDNAHRRQTTKEKPSRRKAGDRQFVIRSSPR